RHPADPRPAPGPQPVPAGHRHRSGAVAVDHQGPGDVRALRARGPRPWRARRGRPGLPRLHPQRTAAARVPGRADLAPAAVLPGGDARAVPVAGPRPARSPDRTARQRPHGRRPRPGPARSGTRPRDDLRQPADAGRLPRDPRPPRLQRRAAHRHAGRLRVRARVRREVSRRPATHPPGVESGSTRRMQAMKILVPVDGSDASTRALRHALALCKAFRSGKLLVVAVDDSLFPGAERKMGAEAAAAHHAENFERMLGPARKLLSRRKVKVDFIELVGDVAAIILEAAAAKKADVIVMGSRGAGGIKGVLLGSVSQKVLAGTPVPVTIVN